MTCLSTSHLLPGWKLGGRLSASCSPSCNGDRGREGYDPMLPMLLFLITPTFLPHVAVWEYFID
jgi:hypothetical protein